MFFKKFEAFFTFIAFIGLVFSSPIVVDEKDESIKSIQPTNYPQPIADGLSVIEIRDNIDIRDVLLVCDNYNVNVDCINNILTTLGNSNPPKYSFKAEGMTGSAFSVPKKDGDGYYVGRNLDFNNTDSQHLVLVSYPVNNYSSISTVNLDFLKKLEGEPGLDSNSLTLAIIFGSLDGMNEKGVAVSVLMNEGDVLKSGLNPIRWNATASFMVRVILDIASSTDKAIDLLRSFQIHNNFDFNVHFMISDAHGKSVDVEYIIDKKGATKLVVTETPVVTNFSISSGEKSGPGIERFHTMEEMIASTPKMNVAEVRETLEAVKNNTQCSIVYDVNNREAIYYVRENFRQGYKIHFDKTSEDDIFPPNPEDEIDFETVDIDVTNDVKNVGGTKFKVVEFDGDYGFDEFLAQNGARSEEEIIEFLLKRRGIKLPVNTTEDFDFSGQTRSQMKLNALKGFDACSGFNVQNGNGDGYIFGRNYDWNNGTAFTVITRPKNKYASISTIDTLIINRFFGGKSMEDIIKTIAEPVPLEYELPDELMKEVAIYFPFDGINEKGLTVSVNMINCIIPVHQHDEGKVNLTISTINRYLLDTAATVDEAIEKLKGVNVHNGLIHFIITDATGKSVVVEYKQDEEGNTQMFVIETNAVTNAYLADDDDLKSNNYDVLTKDIRYDILRDRLAKKPQQTVKDARNTLRAGNQDHTAWSIVYDKMNKEATYFIENDFSVGYRIRLNAGKEEETTSEIPEDGDEEQTVVSEELEDPSLQNDVYEDNEEKEEDDDKTVV